MSARVGTFVTRRLTTCATTTIVALTRRNAKPALIGVNPITFCTYCVRKKNIANTAAPTISITA